MGKIIIVQYFDFNKLNLSTTFFTEMGEKITSGLCPRVVDKCLYEHTSDIRELSVLTLCNIHFGFFGYLSLHGKSIPKKHEIS